MALFALFFVLGQVAFGQPSASADGPKGFLTVTKVCDPVDADGSFTIRVDGNSYGTFDCGESTGTIHLSPGTHTVSETGTGEFTSEFSDDCNSSGQVNIEENETATCTITNTFPDEAGSLIVSKVCDPVDVDASFSILVDGESVGSLDCGESTLGMDLEPGTYTVSEESGDFTRSFSGDCDSSGDVEVDSGETATCIITNTFEEDPGLLTITKICDPVSDDGEFIIRLDGVSQGQRGCGESVFDIELDPGTYTVSETAGPGTSLGDYTSSFGGDCDASGDVEISSGEGAACTITNVLEEPEDGSLTVTKLCSPADDDGNFTILVDGVILGPPDLDCGESTVALVLAPGTYTVSEQAGTGTDLDNYVSSTFGGDCASNGDVTISAGEDASCTLTNVREAAPEVVIVTVPQAEVVVTEAALPPAAPVEVVSAAPAEAEAVAPAPSVEGVTALPSTGSGGYETSNGNAAWIGVLLLAGAGILGLAVRRRSRG